MKCSSILAGAYLEAFKTNLARVKILDIMNFYETKTSSGVCEVVPVFPLLCIGMGAPSDIHLG